uniref:Uncharacterized protein n=1 Tax=Rhizophora mucronata TaxID=61149 RepID=A0A2P2IPT1_RHIMU
MHIIYSARCSIAILSHGTPSLLGLEIMGLDRRPLNFLKR